MSSTSLKLVLSLALFVGGTRAADSKHFVVVPGRGVMTCDQAYSFRDGPLLEHYDLLASRYDDGREQRLRQVRTEFEQHRAELEHAWNQVRPELRNKVAANGITLALSLGSGATGNWANRVLGDGANVLVVKAEHVAQVVTQGTMTDTVEINTLLEIPIMTLLAAATSSTLTTAATVYAVTSGTLNVATAYADLRIAQIDYEGQARVFSNAILKVAERSVTNQLVAVNAVKNEIDRVCGMR